MNNSLTKLQAWRSRRQLRSLRQWERIRADGKTWFVSRTALGFGLTITGGNHVLDHVFDGTQAPISLVSLLGYVLGGIVAGFVGWNGMEDKYQNALRESRAKASPSGELPARNSPLRITVDSQSN